MQVKALKQLQESNVVGSGGGEGGMMVNWYENLVKNLTNEVLKLLQSAKKLMWAPTKSHGAARMTGKFADEFE